MTAATQSSSEADARNPLLEPSPLPRFDRIEPRHVVPAVETLLSDATAALEAIEADPPAGYALVEALDTLGEPFEHVWGPISHLHGVKNSPELREAYQTVLPRVVQFGLRLKQSRPIYEALKALRDGSGWDELSESRKRVVSKQLLSAELAGIGLEEDDRKRFNELAEEASKLSTDFQNHVLDATKGWSLTLTDFDEIAGLPTTAKRLAANSHNAAEEEEGRTGGATPESGPWRITLEAPSVGPFLEHARRRDLRERVYRAFVTRASSGELDNGPIIVRLLAIRKEEATLLGYPHFAAVSLAQKMAEDVDEVEELLERLRTAAWPGGERDLTEIRAIAAEHGVEGEVMNWDVSFLAERLRESRFEITDEQLRPYFPFESVLDGLFALCGRLFGIRVEPDDGEVPTWNKDVRFFKVFDEDAAPDGRAELAAFYLDPYSRPKDKRGGAWMDDCLGRRRRADGSVQPPVAHLVCNQTPPSGDTPSLMSFREVETLFHEFGHGLQHMLTTVDEPDVAGISGVEWDAVELPSQFMENWCYHKPTLLGFAKHYETGEPLPDELFHKLEQARTFRAGTQMLRQILFGLTDLELHSRHDPGTGETPTDVRRRIAAKTSVMPPLPEDRSLCGFAHVFAGGYAAGYYSYKWAEVLSADAFAAFEEAGLDDEAAVESTGRRFRDTVLSLGGSRPPAAVFESFRGRPPRPDALLRHSGLTAS